jgi:anti-sigma B factor antagonist
VTLEGELDMVNAPTVAETLDTLVAAGQPVVVDLTELAFIDSSGIHALVRPRGDGGAMELVCPPGNIRRVLELTKLQNVLQVHDTLDEALAAAA